MAVVTYLLRADRRKRWRSLALLTLLVAIVVGAVLTSAAGARRADSAFDRYLEEVRPFDALVVFRGDPMDLHAIEQLDGVEAAVGYHWYAVFPGDPETDFFPLFVPADSRVPNTYMRAPVVAGRAPNPAEPLEIALGERSARRLGVTVGDRLPVATFTPETTAAILTSDDPGPPGADGPALELDVVGIVRDPGDLVSRETDISVNFLTPGFAESYGDDLGTFGTGMLLATEPGADLDVIARAIGQYGDFELDSFLGADNLRIQADPTVGAMADGLRIVALITLLAGGVLVVQAVARATTDRLGDLGPLRALGAGRALLLAQLGLSSTLAALAGVVVGGAASIALSPFVLWGLARRAEVDGGVQHDPVVLIVGMVGAAALLAIIVAGAGILALRRAGGASDTAGRPSAVAARAASLGAPVPIVSGLRLAFERGRGGRATPVAAAAAAAAVGGLGVMATVVFASSLHHAVTTPAVYGWSWEGVLSGTDTDDVGPDGVDIEALASDPAFVAVAEAVIDLEVTIDGSPERAIALEDLRGHTPFVVVEGHEPEAPNEAAIGRKTLDRLGLELGDAIEVSAGGDEGSLQIVGVVALPVSGDGGSSSTGLALRRDTADAIGFSGSCDGDVACSRNVLLTAAPGVDIEAAARPYTSELVELSLPRASSEIERLKVIERLPRLLAGVLGIIAVVAVVHTASVTVRRRRQDLAILRVLGLAGRQLRGVAAVQVMVLALGGAALGVVLGVALGRQLWTAVAHAVPLPVIVSFPALSIVVIPIAIALAALMGATFSRRAAGRVPAAVALRTE